MRVIAGEAKSRRLKSVPGTSTRPITDRVKESLFNILAPRIEGARFLDLFAGTGGVGIEALSRGAERAVFVEKNKSVIAILKENLQLTGLGEGAEITVDDVFRALEKMESGPFDIIYLAPPQYRGLWAQTVQALDQIPLLAEGGLVVAQMHPKEYQDLSLQRLRLVDQRRYGSTLLCFYSYQAPDRLFMLE